MHDLVAVDLRTDDGLCSTLLASIICDLSSDLHKLQMAVLDDEPNSGYANLAIRHDVRRLPECCPASPAELDLMPAHRLREPVLSLEARKDDIMRALALLLTGV